ncbi:hypothetical protein JR316_0005802 [Psilocybe cubensis]|uniref:Uncharacterized protein n=2 Tax=Psilocybe cubensis TaxID=181762 RepID=A0ACB8H260_PSICU|nr:hypothetical protein JR316_0005802 [Psilocybe cubensis]KAH9481280.1 hypothetical protein JR316_0005802 [Psilocybe cubensis]
MSVSSMHSAAPSSNSRFSNEPIPQPESTEMNQTTRDPEKSPSPVPEIIEEQETAEPQPPRPVLPCHNVPGLWFVKLALDNMGTLNCDFQIDQETALKWNIGQTNNEDAVITDFHSVQVPRKRLSLQICSFSKQLVQGVIETLGTDQTPATIASAIFGLEQKWPNQGQLIVKINPDTANTKTWLPNRLGLNNAPVQIEDFVQEGQNVVQFIQLSGMSDNLFALCASERND